MWDIYNEQSIDIIIHNSNGQESEHTFLANTIKNIYYGLRNNDELFLIKCIKSYIENNQVDELIDELERDRLSKKFLEKILELIKNIDNQEIKDKII